jgi:hypothetical protein
MEQSLTDADTLTFLSTLFPGGLEDPALVAELAPEGWAASPLVRVAHPTVEQRYAEAVAIHQNIERLKRPDAPAGPPPATFEEIQKEHREAPVDPEQECANLLGSCLWDLLSDNHEIVTAAGERVHLGSFRMAAGIIAEFRAQGHARDLDSLDAGYLDFYLGTVWVSQRADLMPVYACIFRRMRRQGLDWRYVHPRLMLVDLSGLAEAVASGTPDWVGYDPSAAIAQEQERRERDRQRAEFQAEMDTDYRESIAAAREAPPPRTVEAYRQVYGRWPQGWPPEDDTSGQ